MAYVRKTEDEYLVMYDYGYGDGVEVLTTCSTRSEAMDDIIAYYKNEHIRPVIKKHRVKIS